MAKNVARIFLAIAVLSVPALADDWSKRFAIAGRPELRVDANDGSVTIRTWDRKEIEARVTTTGWRISPAEVRVIDHQMGDHVDLELRIPHRPIVVMFGVRRIQMELQVPRDLRADIHTADGAITLDGVHGDIHLTTGDGHIAAGADGTIGKLKGNQLVRTRNAYLARGLAVLVVDRDLDHTRAVDYMAAIKQPVTVIATSRGTLRAACGIAGGARPDALVLTSGFLTDGSGSHQNVANILGSPRSLPRTLVIAHRHDSCRFTLPAGVDPFIRWAGGKASVKWLDGGENSGDPCQARAYHGFNGLDGEVVSIAAGFH